MMFNAITSSPDAKETILVAQEVFIKEKNDNPEIQISRLPHSLNSSFVSCDFEGTHPA